MENLSRRRWTLAPLPARVDNTAMSFRSTAATDDAAIVALLTESYVGTVDSDRAHYVDELRRWRQLDDADDDASVVVVSGSEGRLVGASLIARELDTPFLYEIVVTPQYRRSGIGRALLARSIGILAERGEDALSAWVTYGNQPSEFLLASMGFICVTPPVQRLEAVKYYRAAAAIRAVDTSGVHAIGASVEDVGPTLWVVRTGGSGEAMVTVRDTVVRIVTLAPDDPRVSEIASRAIPISGIPWLLRRRVPTVG
ncbi:MAG TPA: GNAT family N-acetyltransferase [Acidimicrobiia bacterium]|nr:GNAT family N-acetyltransferase [Acidimicrobiia bacterium]